MTAAKRQKERASIPIKSERKQYIKATWANKRVIERGTTCKKKKKKRQRDCSKTKEEEKQNSRQRSACNPLWWRCAVSLTGPSSTPACLPSALPRKKKQEPQLLPCERPQTPAHQMHTEPITHLPFLERRRSQAAGWEGTARNGMHCNGCARGWEIKGCGGRRNVD